MTDCQGSSARPVGLAATRRASLALLALMLCVYGATTGGSVATDLASYEVTRSIVEHGSVAMSFNVLDTEAERGVDGRYYAPVGIGHPLYSVPFYLVARGAQQTLRLRIGKPESLTKAGVVAGSAVASALVVLVVFRFALSLTGVPGAAAGVALACGLGTTLWPYSKFGFNAPLAALAVLAGTYWVWLGARRGRDSLLALGAACLGFGALTRHELFVLAIPAIGWLWLESTRVRQFTRRLLVFSLPMAMALGVWLSYNYIRFGHPLDTGLWRDPAVRFDGPMLAGLHGLLLSPGRSLVLYNPLVVLGLVSLTWLFRRDRNTALLVGGTAVTLLLVIARMRQWDGGESYGPRYLVPVVPVLLLPIAPWLAAGRRRWTFWILLIVGVLVQLPGILVDFSKVQHEYARRHPGYAIDQSRYTWDASPLVLDTAAAIAAIPENARFVFGLAVPPDVRQSGAEVQRDFSQQFSFSLDFWWLYLFYLGAVPAWVSVGLVGLLGAGAVCSAWVLRRAIGVGTPPAYAS